jgi:hypothetical protein
LYKELGFFVVFLLVVQERAFIVVLHFFLVFPQCVKGSRKVEMTHSDCSRAKVQLVLLKTIAEIVVLFFLYPATPASLVECIQSVLVLVDGVPIE